MHVYNPIDISVEKDLLDRIGVPANFVHNFERGGSNIITIDAGLTPTETLIQLDSGLGFAYMGQGMIRVFGCAHFDLANMVSLFPDLLLEDDSKCPLYSLMDEYVEDFSRTSFKPTHMLTYLTLLSINQDVLPNVNQERSDFFDNYSLKGIHKLIQNFNRQDDLNWNRSVALGIQTGEINLQSVLDSFGNKTEEYILHKNPDFPKQGLLTRKMQSIRDKLSMRSA